MRPLVQDYLLTHSFTEMAVEHGVYAGFSHDRRKVSLSYDQIEAKETDVLARQCRGLILSKADGTPFLDDGFRPGDTKIVARPFDRFFNHGQNGADASALLGKDGTKIFEKLDGTLCIVYHDANAFRFCVATRSVPDADKPVDGWGQHTFSTLFEAVLKEHTGYDLQGFGSVWLNPTLTYLFELTGPYNRVVVEYEKGGLHLLGVRVNENGREVCPSDLPAEIPGIPIAPHHAVGTLEALVELVSSKDPRKHEGVVVRGPVVTVPGPALGSFARIKLKNPAYVALHGLKSSVANSPRRLMELTLLGHSDDVMPMLARDIQEIGVQYTARFAKMCGWYDTLYDEAVRLAEGKENPRKEIALFAQRGKYWVPAFMERFVGRATSFRDFVDKKKKDGTWPDSFLDNLIEQLPEV